MKKTTVTGRAEGALMGQFAGDALGGQVEFLAPDIITARFPSGLRQIRDGGTWNTIAGQPTDDSEMALMLAASLVGHPYYSEERAMAGYRWWWRSAPFDRGLTIMAAMGGHPDETSQANGAMMRVSPLAVFGAGHCLEDTARWAIRDAALTHPHPVCLEANALYAMAIAHAIRTGPTPEELYAELLSWVGERKLDPSLEAAIRAAAVEPPQNYGEPVAGWVLVAFQNALYRLLHAESFEEGVVETVMEGYDSDTNAAICGALLGSVYGIESVPEQWRHAVLNCRPEAGSPGVHRPRPKELWPVDVLELAHRLLPDA